ncbi:cytochrome d ubiquinol oxidase subunit II [Halococcus sp. IIIV-5B]|uniref:cytochrome d ubiquinol oxidase subunit II n=1 Tax=Halococcus sp. IIIV-5B TaxID=2321230 RepID=UPI000E72EB38|nr:cytochrome d ubiquinol oxidase subunit II [Halococcus sp. IIIV-5B]RJT06197.1 cytochrome d ubiquinol oxidase subunit II [Halococcus sp. IIIV-5B]
MIESVLSLDSAPLFGLPLEAVWFVVLFFFLAMFLFLDGFDFGIGALFATRNDEEDRHQLLAAVGPFWDGNEVWLVVFGGAMFAAFPAVYANLFSRNYLLLFALLFALGLRGLAPEFYEQREDREWRRAWGWAFVVGSVAAPFTLGMFAANWLLGSTQLVTIPGVVVGLAVVALTIVEGSGFLVLKTRGALPTEMRRYGTRAAVAYLVLVVVTLGWLLVMTPRLRDALLAPLPLALVVLTVLLVAGVVVAHRREADLAAFCASGGLAFGLVALVATLLYPTIDPAADLTVGAAVVPLLSLNLMTIMAGVLLPIILAYFAVLYSVFSGPIEPEETY